MYFSLPWVLMNYSGDGLFQRYMKKIRKNENTDTLKFKVKKKRIALFDLSSPFKVFFSDFDSLELENQNITFNKMPL